MLYLVANNKTSRLRWRSLNSLAMVCIFRRLYKTCYRWGVNIHYLLFKNVSPNKSTRRANLFRIQMTLVVIWATVWKHAILKNCLKIPRYEFKCWRHLPCLQIRLRWNFHEDSISSYYVKLLTVREIGRQTDRQTDRRRVKHNLPGGGN